MIGIMEEYFSLVLSGQFQYFDDAVQILLIKGYDDPSLQVFDIGFDLIGDTVSL